MQNIDEVYKRLKRLSAVIAVSLCFLTTGMAKPLVVVTTTQLQDLVNELAGGSVTMHGLMGPGVDPHLYKPTAGDIRQLRQADLILYNSLNLEGRLEEVMHRLRRQGRSVLGVGEALDPAWLITSRDMEKHYDPHIWFDPALWGEVAVIAGQRLAELVPEERETILARAAKLKQRYSEIEVWGRELVTRVPEERRILVTSHDAFQYFGRSFGLEVVGVQGISTVAEAGLADIQVVADYIKARGVPAIFVESSVSPAAIERVRHDAGVRLGGELYSDAMGAPGEQVEAPDGHTYDTGTWEGMMRYNLIMVTYGLK